jgi:glycosyltransferase involved in cell wall biosynthesis
MVSKRVRVLIVGMLDSIHLARWLEQFSREDIDFILFPSTPHRRIHGQIKSLINTNGRATYKIVPGMRMFALPLAIADLFLANKIRGKILQLLIDTSRAEIDVVHSHETQHAGYLSDFAIRKSHRKPKHILSIWGSDLFWFKQFKKHRTKIREVLEQTDNLILECERDIKLAYELGYQGDEPILTSASGGFGKAEIELGRHSQPTSERKTILVKGYTGFVGRADLALKAIEELSNELNNFKITVYSTDFRTRQIIMRLRRATNLTITSFKKHELSHSAMLSLFREARIHIGISESDGMPGSLREAMLNGCIPIQTDTSCGNEWVEHLETGFLVSTKRTKDIVDAIRIAIQNDSLVDSAARANLVTMQARLAGDNLHNNVRNIYF